MKFKIYSSSAGSGKTYTLTKEYLQLALNPKNPFYFKHILAITFTNDAANEMKERILKALKGFAYPEKTTIAERNRNLHLLKEIAQHLQLDVHTVQLLAAQVFQKIIYNYSDFAVSTIDSFANNIVAAFTKELDLPYNYDIDLDTNKLLRAAIDRLLDRVGTEGNEQLSQIIVKWTLEKIEEGKSWSRIATELVEFAQRDLLNERNIKYINALKVLDLNDFSNIDTQLRAFLAHIESQVKAPAQAALDILHQQGLKIEDLYYGSRGIGGHFVAVASGKDLFKEAKSYTKQTIENDRWYSGKKVNEAVEAIAEKLKTDFETLTELQAQYKANYNLARMVLKHLYQISLAQEIAQELEAVKKDNNTVYIGDINQKIASIIAHEPIPFIYERVGEKYHHILIDEFQDTSVLQWQNLMPLVENNLAESHFNLIVGDAKQAIYRWRGGEMEQLVYLFENNLTPLMELGNPEVNFLEERYETLQQHHQPAQLNFNFRSTQEIILFNNHFFKFLVDLRSEEYALLARIYNESFEQRIPEGKPLGKGHVQIDLLEKNRELYAEMTFQKILERIEEAICDGFRPKDIAILCRKNDRAKQVANFLKENNYKVLSQDSLLLASDEKICFIVALIKVMNNPNDRLAKSEALYLFYKAILKVLPSEETNEAIKETTEKTIFDFFGMIQAAGFSLDYTSLQQLNLYELIEKWIEVFELFNHTDGLEYLFKFLDWVLEFTLQRGSSYGDFLTHWAEKRESLSISTPKNLDAVTVTSIHRSKGLEYPVVIFPFVDWDTSSRDNLWLELDDSVEIPIQSTSSGKKLTTILARNTDLKDTSFSALYTRETEKSFIENVNLLYVGFTRAIERLYLIATFEPEKEKNVAYFLYRFLVEKNPHIEPNNTYILYDNRHKHTHATTTYTNGIEVGIIQDMISTDRHKRLRNRPLSQ